MTQVSAALGCTSTGTANTSVDEHIKACTNGQAGNALKHGLSVPIKWKDLNQTHMEVVKLLQAQGLSAMHAQALTIKIAEFERNAALVRESFWVLSDWPNYEATAQENLKSQFDELNIARLNIERSRSYLANDFEFKKSNPERKQLSRILLRESMQFENRFSKEVATGLVERQRTFVSLNRYFRRAALQMIKALKPDFYKTDSL